MVFGRYVHRHESQRLPFEVAEKVDASECGWQTIVGHVHNMLPNVECVDVLWIKMGRLQPAGSDVSSDQMDVVDWNICWMETQEKGQNRAQGLDAPCRNRLHHDI